MGRKLGVPNRRGYLGKLEQEAIDEHGRPLEPPRPSDIEGRPAVGDKGGDPLLDALIRHHEERDPAKIKKEEDDDDANRGP